MRVGLYVVLALVTFCIWQAFEIANLETRARELKWYSEGLERFCHGQK
jgi:hypothetical protein